MPALLSMGLAARCVLVLAALLIGGAAPHAQESNPAPRPEKDGSNATNEGERTGGWRLADANSVYLREHAENPIDWYPWGEEALERARAEDKLIFLSIGYSSCHWCHVMRRRSFTQHDVAAALRDGFISIKVDREELPHVDDAYMKALQALNRGGGWPLSAFLTPDGRPFTGGTYIPKDDFLDALDAMRRHWKDPERRKEILATSARVIELLEERPDASQRSPELAEFLDAGLAGTLRRFDPDFGGFSRPGVWSPKFPHPRLLVYYTALDKLEGRPELRDKVALTLRRMSRGGIFDQVGGGFHRYTVDREWVIPHFEKMLYSQGLLAETYLEVFRMTGEREFADVARRTLDALLRDFGLESGGFASAWDADSGEEEGVYYLWTPDSLEAAVGKQLAPLMTNHLGITPQGNFAGGGKHAIQTIPTVARTIPELASELFMEPKEVQELIDAGFDRMLSARARRVAPKRDDKVILGWNALAVSALAKGAILLEDDRYRRAATSAQALLAKHLAREDGFRRVYFGSGGAQPATLTDVSLYLKACLDLYHATLEPKHIAEAVRAARRIESEYGPTDDGDGAFFEARAGDEVLVSRKKTFQDSALPSGNATLTRCYLRLHALTGNDHYEKRARALIAAGLRRLAEFPGGSPEFMLAALMSRSPLPEVAVAGSRGAESTKKFLAIVQRGEQPFAVLALRPPGEAGAAAARTIPLLAQKEANGATAIAYLCFDFRCLAPETDPAAFATAFQKSWKPRFEDDRPSSRPNPRPDEG